MGEELELISHVVLGVALQVHKTLQISRRRL